MAAIYTIFELNISGFQKNFSGLMAEPTNQPPVRDYDPDTPLIAVLFPTIRQSGNVLDLLGFTATIVKPPEYPYLPKEKWPLSPLYSASTQACAYNQADGSNLNCSM